MLQELFNLVKGHATESVIDNPDVPNEHNNEVVAEATNTVASGLRNMVAGGGLQNVLSLFGNDGKNKGGLLSNPLVSMMIGHFAGKLMSKFRMNNNQAGNVANNLIPGVLGSLVNKVNDPNDQSFSLEKLLGSITGNKQNDNAGGGLNLQDILSKFTGGQQNGGGGLGDLVGRLASGAQSQQQKNGGGLLDLIKGFAR